MNAKTTCCARHRLNILFKLPFGFPISTFKNLRVVVHIATLTRFSMVMILPTILYKPKSEAPKACKTNLVDTREITVTTNSRKYTKNVFLTIRLSDVSLIYYISSVRIL